MAALERFGAMSLLDKDFFEFNCYDTANLRVPLLAAGDQISTATVTTSVLLAPNNITAEVPLVVVGWIIGGPSTAPNTIVTVELSGGTGGVTYLVTILITTVAGRTLERSAELLVAQL